ncbi:MAG: MotA/TolQ/ExbB proton channel family protein, partial [Rhodothermales bacterium]
MEKATVIGIGSGLVLIYGAIFLGEGWQMFFDPASAVLVIGGTISAMFVTFSLAELKNVPSGFKEFLSFEEPELFSYLHTFGEFSRIARREGLLALDRQLDEDTDDFIRFGLEMAVDGIEEAEIDDLMKMRMAEEAQKRGFVGKFFTNAGTYAPAFGMIGTLIGLIQMMQSLDDPSKIGAGMAVALITTFYGALLANLFLLPVATKARTQVQLLMKARQMARTGVLAIVRGEAPSMIEKRLQSYLDEEEVAQA